MASSDYEPSAPFWKGHQTTPEGRAALLARVLQVWGQYPYLRFGQLMSHLCLTHNTWDEEVIKRLDSMGRGDIGSSRST